MAALSCRFPGYVLATSPARCRRAPRSQWQQQQRLVVIASAIQSRNSNRNDDDDRPRLSAEGSQALDPEETEGRDTQRELMEEFAASVCQGLEGVSYRLTTKEEDEADLLDIGNPIEDEKEDDIWGRTDAQPLETLEFLQATTPDQDQGQES